MDNLEINDNNSDMSTPTPDTSGGDDGKRLVLERMECENVRARTGRVEGERKKSTEKMKREEGRKNELLTKNIFFQTDPAGRHKG